MIDVTIERYNDHISHYYDLIVKQENYSFKSTTRLGPFEKHELKELFEILKQKINGHPDMTSIKS